MDFNKTDAAYLVANINDTRHIPHIRRNGPMANVVLPIVHYDFLVSQSYSMDVLKAVLKNGTVIMNPTFATAKEQPAVKATPIAQPVEVESFVEEKPIAIAEPVIEVPAIETPAPELVQEVEEPKQLEDTNGDGKINLMDTITETEGEISLNVLTLDQYESYTKAELFEFLSKIADQFPADVKKMIKKSATEKQLLEVIAANLL